MQFRVLHRSKTSEARTGIVELARGTVRTPAFMPVGTYGTVKAMTSEELVDIGYELIEVGRETMSFYETWLASAYVENSVGVVTVDSLPAAKDHAGGSAFMTNDVFLAHVRSWMGHPCKALVHEPLRGKSGPYAMILMHRGRTRPVSRAGSSD